MQAKNILPLIISFLVLSLVILAGKLFYHTGQVDYGVVLFFNCLFFLSGLLVFRMLYRAMQHSNPNVFVRTVMAGTMLKMGICIVAVIGYYFVSRPAFNKPAVYAGMIIYVVYLVVVVRTVMQLNRKQHA
ncbi:MAG TPA: hypothetical protein PKM83_02075 [Ferruginibacter sp.]|nr:hypothetical protein [Ferruginibacter sp.]HNO98501.1 hypothetical protein [Ferruginibacter sp.]